MAGGPYACRAGRAACGPALVGPAWPPGLARRGTRARQVGKEPHRAAPGTRSWRRAAGGRPVLRRSRGHAHRSPQSHETADAPRARRRTGCDDCAGSCGRAAGPRCGRKGAVITVAAGRDEPGAGRGLLDGQRGGGLPHWPHLISVVTAGSSVFFPCPGGSTRHPSFPSARVRNLRLPRGGMGLRLLRWRDSGTGLNAAAPGGGVFPAAARLASRACRPADRGAARSARRAGPAAHRAGAG